MVRLSLLTRLIAAICLSCCAFVSSAHAEKRVALVIGNSAYRSAVALTNPANDAKLMADTLTSLGFYVVGGGAQVDLDKAGFDAALDEFSRKLIGADIALFYYAGHGIETHGINYLVPIDANPQTAADIDPQLIGLTSVLDRIQSAGARINLLLVDACRDNPFHGTGSGGGLAQMQAPPGTLISFATQPRSVAFDGEDGHSPYSRALAETIQHPGYGLFKTFNEVGLAVEKATQSQQLPWVSTSPIAGNFYFAGKAAVATATPTSPTQGNETSLRIDLVTDCDRLAAMPYDTGRPPHLPGVEFEKIDTTAATTACDAAMKQYPDVMRFVFEAGRVAYARKDAATARTLYQQAADGGYAMGYNNIGTIYEDKDNTEAAKWYRKAVDAGIPIAMVNLGWFYEGGKGVKKDCAEAVRLYQTAVEAGLSPAMNNLGVLYTQGKCVQRDYAEALRLFQQGAALGNDAAMNGMGALYNDGHGVARNTRVARDWFEKAAALGNPEAKENLRDMKR